MDPSTGDSLGIDVKTVDQGLPVAFSVPYSIADVQPTADYVVTAEVGDSTGIWRNAAGVPVITKGNPKAGVQVVVTPGLDARAERDARPGPSAAPVETGRGGDGGLLPLILLVAIAGAVAAFLVARGRGNPDTPTPDPAAAAAAGAAADSDPDAAAAAAAGAATEPAADAGAPADAAEAPTPEATPPTEPPGPPPDASRPT